MNWSLIRKFWELDDELGTDELLRRSVPSWRLYLVDQRRKFRNMIERMSDTEVEDSWLFTDED
jgi:hypothetical protein